MNKSGIYPCGDRVLVKPDTLEEKTEGGIIIPATDRDRHQMAQATGVLVAMGPDVWTHSIETVERLIDGAWKEVERKRTGYSEPFAKVGDRVSFAKYAGLQVTGEDGESYRILNDEDITTVVSEKVEFTDLKTRQRL